MARERRRCCESRWARGGPTADPCRGRRVASPARPRLGLYALPGPRERTLPGRPGSRPAAARRSARARGQAGRPLMIAAMLALQLITAQSISAVPHGPVTGVTYANVPPEV